MKRYDSYKDSGVKWLGEIPSHWEMKRWRFLMVENTKKNSDRRVRLQLQFRYGDIVRKANQSEESDVLDTISKYTVVEPNDIMINGLNLNYDFVSQRVAQVNEEGVITSAYISLRPTNIACSKYYTYFLKSMDSKKMFHGMGTGIRLTLSYNELKNQFIPRPSIEEQEAIANYLDATTSKIDAAIAQQQKMIDLLNERKQIIINNVVTKGLDPNVKMKPSGVDWIGDIPEHWEFVPIKRYNNVCTGKTPSTTKEYYFENGDICWYTPGDLNQFNLNSSERKVTERAKKENACPIFPSNTVYLVGIGGTIGKVSYAERESSCNQQINAIVPQKDYVYYKYLAYSLQTFKIQIYQNANLSTLPIMNQERTGALQMLLPPQVEQKAIVEYIEKAIRPVDLAIEGTNKQISLLQERKQIIINDVVTGKVKVV